MSSSLRSTHGHSLRYFKRYIKVGGMFLSIMLTNTYIRTDVAEGSVLVISSALEEIYEMFPSNLPAYQVLIIVLFLLLLTCSS